MSTETSLTRALSGRLTPATRKKVVRVLAKPGVSLRSKTIIRKWLRSAPTVVTSTPIDIALIEAHSKRPIW